MIRAAPSGGNGFGYVRVANKPRLHIGKHEGMPPVVGMFGEERSLLAMGNPEALILVTLLDLDRKATGLAFPIRLVWNALSFVLIPDLKVAGRLILLWREAMAATVAQKPCDKALRLLPGLGPHGKEAIFLLRRARRTHPLALVDNVDPVLRYGDDAVTRRQKSGIDKVARL